jgi:hypothetical protein
VTGTRTNNAPAPRLPRSATASHGKDLVKTGRDSKTIKSTPLVYGRSERLTAIMSARPAAPAQARDP